MRKADSMEILLIVRCLGCAFAAMLLCPTLVVADPVADFYRDKTISLYVGFPPGGGYDLYARVFAPHFTRHIPGNPLIVVKNMPGGVGVRAAGFISTATPQDGTSLGLFLDATTLAKTLGGPGDFKPDTLTWIGRIVPTTTASVAWHTSPAQSVEEAKSKEIVIGASVAASSSSFIPLALNDLVGTKFKVVRGYQGSASEALAMERGEVHAIGGISWDVVQTSKRDWIAENKIKILYVHGTRRAKELPDHPTIVEFATSEKSRRILALLGSGPDIGRAIAAEPQIPPARAAALRRAFVATMTDPAFVEEMKRRNLSIDALSGEDIQKLVEAVVATPQDLIDQAKGYLQP
jgi:tripartite-type tricarboxylate transporter receptor subunit TctC